MIGTATHDTKRGEDVRARLNVLSELPDDWAREVAGGCAINRAHRTRVDGEPAPDRNDEYLFYQALVGDLARRDLRAASEAGAARSSSSACRPTCSRRSRKPRCIPAG